MLGIFDGDCGICSAFVDSLRTHGVTPNAVTFEPSQAFDDAALLAFGLTREACMGAFILADASRRAVLFTGARAINEVLIRTGHPLANVASALLAIPGVSWIEELVYALIARNRTWLSVRFGLRACSVTPRGRAKTSADGQGDAPYKAFQGRIIRVG